MREKFTKGPWKANFYDYTKPYVEILNEDNVVIVQIPDGEVIKGDKIILGLENIEANIDLIAAAPDMYEALEEVCHLVCATCSKYEQFCESGNRLTTEIPCNTCESKVFKALRKARGESE